MNKLKETFTKNGLPYKLIKRNDKVAMYGVGGTYTDKILHYEVCKIQFRKAGSIQGHSFHASESLPSNEQFGREGSRAILNYQEALTYFDILTVQGPNRVKVDNISEK